MPRLFETKDDVQQLAVKMRVDISSGPTDLQDILTTLRGLPNIITVSQQGSLSPAGPSKEWLKALVKFENTISVDLITLKDQIEKLPTVDLVSFKAVDGVPYSLAAAQKDFDVARSKRGQAHARSMNLGKYTLESTDYTSLRKYVRAILLNS